MLRGGAPGSWGPRPFGLSKRSVREFGGDPPRATGRLGRPASPRHGAQSRMLPGVLSRTGQESSIAHCGAFCPRQRQHIEIHRIAMYPACGPPPATDHSTPHSGARHGFRQALCTRRLLRSLGSCGGFTCLGDLLGSRFRRPGGLRRPRGRRPAHELRRPQIPGRHQESALP